MEIFKELFCKNRKKKGNFIDQINKKLIKHVFNRRKIKASSDNILKRPDLCSVVEFNQ